MCHVEINQNLSMPALLLQKVSGCENISRCCNQILPNSQFSFIQLVPLMEGMGSIHKKLADSIVLPYGENSKVESPI
jgi:hypothetical protein